MVIQGVKYPSDFEAKKAMIDAAKRLSNNGFAIGGDGSLSVRVGPNAVWITVHGADKGALTQDMMVRVDMNGRLMVGAKNKVLPEDLPVHLKAYAGNEKIQCVIHAYPPTANALAMHGKNIECAGFSPAVRSMGRIQVVPEESMEATSTKVSTICKNENGVLLQNDGCMFWGAGVSEAFQRVEAVEYYAKVLSSLGMMPVADSGVYNMVKEEPSSQMLPETKSGQVLKGVTAIVRPGNVPEKEKMERSLVSQTVHQTVSQMSSIPSYKKSSQGGKTETHPIQPTEGVKNVTDVSKELVMQEVVRRVLMNLDK